MIGLTKPILIVLLASAERGRAQIGSAKDPATTTPPAPTPARLMSSLLEIRRASNSPGMYDLLGSVRGTRADVFVPADATTALVRLSRHCSNRWNMAGTASYSQSLERGLAILSAFRSGRPTSGSPTSPASSGSAARPPTATSPRSLRSATCSRTGRRGSTGSGRACSTSASRRSTRWSCASSPRRTSSS